MRLFPIVVSTVLVASLLAIKPVLAADDVQTCKTSDHYHNLDVDYATCDRALKQEGLSKEDRAILLVGRGQAAYFFNRMDLSIADLDEAVSLNPNYGEAYLRRSWTRQYLGQFKAALQDISNLLSMEPDNVDALFAIGFMYSETDQWQSKSLPAFKRALEINPNHYLTRMNLGSLLWTRERRPDLAIIEYDKVLAASDEELSKVKMWSYPGVASLDFRGSTRVYRVRALFNTQDTLQALKELDSIVADYPKVAKAYVTRATFLAGQNKWSETLSDARTAEKLEPYGGLQKMLELQSLYFLKYYDEGLQRANIFLAGGLSDATRAVTLFWRGFFNKQLHNPDEALQDIEDSFSYDSWKLPAIITQLAQRGYYDGQVSDPYSEKIRNGLQACIIDPECGQ